LNLIKENHRLHEEDVIAEHMIPTTFNEETEFLSDSNTNSLKRHYMTFYWKVRKDFLDYIEDSMSHDSLIGSTSVLDPGKVFLAPVRFLPQVFFHMIVRHQRYQRKRIYMIFIIRTSIIHFYPKLILKGTGAIMNWNIKKIRII
jgi:hypothetical protein